jgi:3-isopropylmalate dehydrogenase
MCRVVIISVSMRFSHEIFSPQCHFGGIAIDETGKPLPEETIKACEAADAMLLGAVGGPKWGVGKIRPEQGLLALRVHFDLYANVRPALFPSKSLLAHSPLKAEVAEGTDMIIVRELVKGLYIGERQEADLDTPGSAGEASDMMRYNKKDVQRITRLAAYLAMQSNPPKKIHSVDKANVLACSRLWRRVVTETIEQEFADKGVEVDHQLVDSAAMVMVSNPRKLNGIVITENVSISGSFCGERRVSLRILFFRCLETFSATSRR